MYGFRSVCTAMSAFDVFTALFSLPFIRLLSEGRSIQSDVGVEFIGVSWRSKASRSGIESEGPWAEREDGKSP